jgi:uncharacterized protein YidB (DUF937 family)
MGLFDALAKEFLAKIAGGSSQNPLLGMALSLLTNPRTGGLESLVETFKGKGVGDIISSWIGTGENQPISGNQLLNVLGNDQIRAMAEKLGMSHQETSSGLANLLPEIIDKLTPNGQLPEKGLLEEAIKMFKGKADL